MTVTTPEHAPTEPAPPMQPADTRPPKKWPTWLIITAAVGALVAFLAAVGAITFAIVSPGADDPRSFISACQDQVKARLKSPATARFPGADAVDESQTQSTIVGAVDSQNSFGALVRTNYQCTLTKNDRGELRISDVNLK